MKRVVIYGRVSLDRSEGKSVDSQLAECKAWADREGWQVVGTYRDDGISASRYGKGKARRGWQATMEAIISGGVDALVVWEISRASRDRVVWSVLLAACQEANVKIGAGGRLHDPADPDDGFMLDLGAALAVRESGVTSKRIRRAVRARAAEGRPHGKLPYGYRREYEEHTGTLLRQVPDETTAPIVREIAERLKAGEALYSVAEDLTARRIPSPRGAPHWDPTMVKRVAISPTNAAIRTLKGEVIGAAAWPPLISEPDHHVLVAKLTDPARQTWRDGSTKHLLVGIAECGMCGSVCRRVLNRGNPSYACAGEGNRTLGRFCTARSQRWVDDLVTDTLLRRVERPDFIEAFATGGSDGAAEAADELRALRARLDSFTDSAAEGGITPASLAKIEARLLPQIEAAERRARNVTPSPVVAALAGPGAQDRWAELTVPQRREAVRALVRVRILPTQRGARRLDEASIEITWATHAG